MVSPKPLSDFVPDVTLIASQFPSRPPHGAGHLACANRPRFRVNKMVLILDIEDEFRRKPESARFDRPPGTVVRKLLPPSLAGP
jgi:hypothetical protein